jgi:hypothetical protein
MTDKELDAIAWDLARGVDRDLSELSQDDLGKLARRLG